MADMKTPCVMSAAVLVRFDIAEGYLSSGRQWTERTLRKGSSKSTLPSDDGSVMIRWNQQPHCPSAWGREGRTNLQEWSFLMTLTEASERQNVTM